MAKHSPETVVRASVQVIARLEAENDKLRTALDWFVTREAPIQSKFDLHGPFDLAQALKANFKRSRKALGL